MTLTTDFGTTDWFAAALKAVLLSSAPECQLIDVTHEISPGDVLCGSIVLERAIAAFPAGTIHLAVVDPGVGSSRRIIVAEIARQLVVCPDNGLITWAVRRHGPAAAYELSWRPPGASATFHGRDIMAPAAGRLVAGEAVESMASPVHDPVLLDLDLAAGAAGRVIYCDRFGNAITNLPLAEESMGSAQRVTVNGRDIGPIGRTYADVGRGEAVALIGSSGLLEISVRDGSAAATLGIRIGDEVRIENGP